LSSRIHRPLVAALEHGPGIDGKRSPRGGVDDLRRKYGQERRKRKDRRCAQRERPAQGLQIVAERQGFRTDERNAAGSHRRSLAKR
jgi:hypothetical protein